MKDLARLGVFRCRFVELTICEGIGLRCVTLVVSLSTGMQCLANLWIDVEVVEHLKGRIDFSDYFYNPKPNWSCYRL